MLTLAGWLIANTTALAMSSAASGVTPLAAEDIARAVVYAIAQPANVSINEMLVRPSGQVR